ncbi:receptor-type tyrosine-protein phosphatase eta-like [Acipenser ruthenus]|uniref:receptor-type tyrosine-protein phosphatase eta-like n=1 Tax=Acipenser ruthenus TaxID=7906 RepID=UPI00274141FE|nr:receptor-type tyrosine-protein phosphatase eta-like [Acipenser ruthenus]
MKAAVIFLAVALIINVDCNLKQFIPTGLWLTWAQSEETCRQRYMELPSMETEVENSNFWSNGRFYGWCWIGLRYNSSNINKTWEWVNGNPTTYSLWAEPPTGVGCGAFYYYSKAWYIRDCKLTLQTVCQAPYPVTDLTTDSVENNTVSLSWSSPSQLYDVPHFFIITYSNSNSDDEGSTNTTSNSTVFSNLRPGRQYNFKVCTTENSTFLRSQPTSISAYIIPSPPGEISIDSVGTVSVSLSWGNPADMEGVQYSFIISCYGSFWGDQHPITTTSNSTVITNLRPGCKYTLSVSTAQSNRQKSLSVSTSFYTNPVPPGQIKIVSVGNNSVSLSWGRPVSMQFSYSYNITYSCSFWDQQDSSNATSESTVISNLRPGSEYVFNVTIVQVNGVRSSPTSISLYTSPSPPEGIRVDFVETNNVSLSWSKPVDMDEIKHSFAITYSCSLWFCKYSTTAASNSAVLSYLKPGIKYIFTVITVQYNGAESTPVSISQYTNPTPPGEISVDFVGNDSISLSWGKPVGIDGIKYSFNITYSCSFWNLRNSTTASSVSIVISNLRPGSEYVFNVTTVQDSAGQSTPASTTLYTLPPPPGKILIDSVESNSVSLSWGSPFVIDGIPHSFIITYSCSFRGHSGSTSAPSNSTVISNLRLGCKYIFSITTVNKGGQSTPAVTSVYIKLALHGEIKIDSVGNDSVSLSWGSPAGMDGVKYSFNITYSCSFWGHNGSTSATSNSTVISKLRPGSKYVFNVTIVQADGVFSTPASISLYTNPAPPGEIVLDSVETKLVSLSWATPIGMDDIPHSFIITYFSFYWDHHGSSTAPSNSTTISNLRAGSEYVFNITTVQDNGGHSTPASISIFTKPNEKRLYLKFVCSSTERFACEKEKKKVQQETEARLAKQLKGLYWKLNWKEKEVKGCIDEPEEDV